MKIALLGSTNSGKTTLGKYLSNQTLPIEYIPTIGVDIMYIYLTSRQKITIYDLAGHDRFWKLCESFLITSDALVFCFDSHSYESFIYAIRKYNECIRLGYTFQKKIIFVATKNDLPPFEDYDHIVKGHLLAGNPYFSTSSKFSIGKEELVTYFKTVYPPLVKLELEEEEEDESPVGNTRLCYDKVCTIQ